MSSAELDDIYQSRYTSFHGLSRVYMGDSNGVKLCRKAAVGEIGDAEVYYNLAMAEHRLDFLESAQMAVRRGLNVDPEHAGLLRLQRQLYPKSDARRAGASGIVKQLLGRLLGRLALSRASAVCAECGVNKYRCLLFASFIIRPGVGQAVAPSHGRGGKSGLYRAGCQVTPGRREPMESATENIPPGCSRAPGKGEMVR